MSGKAGPSAGAPLEGDPAAHGVAVAEGIGTAVSWLTIVPMRGARTFDRITGRRAMAAAPIAGLVPGLAAVLVALIVSGGAWLLAGDLPGWLRGAASGAGAAEADAAAAATSPLLAILAGMLVVCAAELLTRAMHLDGLADVADALGSYRDPEAAREILRAPDTGPMGAGAVALTLAAQAAAFAVLAHGFATALIPAPSILGSRFEVAPFAATAATLVLPFVLGRAAATTACRAGVPPMGPAGFGALVAGTQSTAVLVAWWVPLALVSGVVAGIAGVLACAGALLVALTISRVAVRRLGGVNGDALGAIVQVATLTAAVLFAIG
ncbi:adenosylcobinamide-GDP ribazoletransferase [uncultured Corynebacterium sp.]|uniref:adenosylcobinamide-GDP ribazoletransferase n=1 Tax=uncultured Corynebacterium sp. TaxID=159447 RepID=UPI0025D81F9A|nr:adenosylcobinamide-GDP ribazoletransferase [uncultured Corynebacterium sp.]